MDSKIAEQKLIDYTEMIEKFNDYFREKLLPFGSFSKDGMACKVFICPKCTNTMKDYEINVKFGDKPFEHLMYKCSRCGFIWRTKPADSETKK